MTNDYDSSVRQMLVTRVEATRVRSRRRFLLGSTIAFVLSGALVGGSVAAIASNRVVEVPTAALPEIASYVVDFPPADNVGRELEFVGPAQAYVATGSQTVIVAPRPNEATALFVLIQCLSPGEFSPSPRERPTDAQYSTMCEDDRYAFDKGEMPDGMSFFVEDVKNVINILDVDATEGAEWRLTLAWVKQRPWRTNDTGQTYGLPWGFEKIPDLVQYTGQNRAGDAVEGYLTRADYDVMWSMSDGDPTKPIVILDLYASDGATKIGVFLAGAE